MGVGEYLDNSKLSRGHWRITLISGMSFFTDAYDLFVIGIVLLMLKPIFNLTPAGIGIAASAALFGAVVGPLFFGFVGDKFGRKSAYWMTVSILIIAALGSATSANLIQLIIWRFVLGIGIGGDYPLSATIVAEYANKRDRGKLISSTFAMQGFGLIAGIAIAFLLLYTGLPTSTIWRLLLAIGAVPTMTILYARTKLLETPLYSEYLGKGSKASEALEIVSSGGMAMKTKAAEDANIFSKGRINSMEFLRKRWRIVFATAASWFILDASYYGTAIFTPYLTTFLGFSGIFGPTEASALILLLAAVPGYWVAVALIDRQGRKSMQAVGFFMIAMSFVVIALFGKALLAYSVLLFFFIYGLSFFFSNYGPNTTTYVYPVELYPTQLRARGHGIAAMSGKFGAAISTLFFPLLIAAIGQYSLLGALGVLALLGCVITIALLPETNQKSLLETSAETEFVIITEVMGSEFSRLIGNIVKGADLIAETEKNMSNRKANFKRMRELEHEADLNVKFIMENIINLKANGTAYMDVSHLASSLDDIMDAEEAVAARFVIFDIGKADESMLEMMDETRLCIDVVYKSLVALRDLQTDSGVMQRLSRLHEEGAKYENRVDNMLREALARAMKMNNAKRIIKYKEVYERMEMISDRCIDALDAIGDVALRYAYR